MSFMPQLDRNEKDRPDKKGQPCQHQPSELSVRRGVSRMRLEREHRLYPA